MPWSETYRLAAQRCHALADAEANDLVRDALEDAGGKFVRAMLEHQALELATIKQGGTI